MLLLGFSCYAQFLRCAYSLDFYGPDIVYLSITAAAGLFVVCCVAELSLCRPEFADLWNARPECKCDHSGRWHACDLRVPDSSWRKRSARCVHRGVRSPKLHWRAKSEHLRWSVVVVLCGHCACAEFAYDAVLMIAYAIQNLTKSGVYLRACVCAHVVHVVSRRQPVRWRTADGCIARVQFHWCEWAAVLPTGPFVCLLIWTHLCTEWRPTDRAIGQNTRV